MEKEKFISKLNIKDYNNQLEKILSKKNFPEDAKNLLLSMLYKVENAYDDYSLVNGDTKTKKETLEEILEIIEKDCEQIDIVKTKECKSIIKEKKIITYLNERKMLYEIFKIRDYNFNVEEQYEIIKPALEKSLNDGYCMATNEVIRDFDGWSWNIETDEIEDITSNFIYQTLKILVGHEFLEKWQKDKNQDYVQQLIENLENKYKTELAETLFKVINQIAIINIVIANKEEKDRLIKEQEKLQKKFDELNNKKEYIEKIGNKKKELVGKIKDIDNFINDDRKLKKEFIRRNELLDMNNRIFSLSDFVDILEKERAELVKELNIYSKKMEPLNYIKTKTEIENKLLLLKEIDLKNYNKKIYNTKVKELLKLVCNALMVQVEEKEDKEDIIKLLYKTRYYELIYISKNTQAKELCDFDQLQKMIITKACKQKIITIFSKKIRENYEIIKNIFQIDVIELEKIYFKFLQKDDKIILEIYDEENICKTIIFPKIEELNVKVNKKVKVFI